MLCQLIVKERRGFVKCEYVPLADGLIFSGNIMVFFSACSQFPFHILKNMCVFFVRLSVAKEVSTLETVTSATWRPWHGQYVFTLKL